MEPVGDDPEVRIDGIPDGPPAGPPLPPPPHEAATVAASSHAQRTFMT